MRTGQLGIFAITFLIPLFTIPSAFAEDEANAYFILMEKINDAQEELSTLDSLITSNGLNMGKGLTEYADALDLAVELAGNPETLDEAAAILDGSENTLDDIYKQLEAQIDSRQNVRFSEFVDKAKTSINFILQNARTLGISETVYDELETTLAILESGKYDAIIAATSEDSDLALTASMFPDDHPGFGKASETGKEHGQGKGIGLGEIPPGLQKLPPGIKKQFDISTDSNLGTEGSEGTDEPNGETKTNGNDNSDFFSTLPGYDAASENGKANGQGQGVGLGVGPEAPGIMKKDIDWLYDHGIILDDTWEHSFEDDDFSQGQGQGNQGQGKGKGNECAHGACAGGQGKGQENQGQGNQGQENQGQGNQGQGQGGGPPEDKGPKEGKGPKNK